jgi:hypothetical protein
VNTSKIDWLRAAWAAGSRCADLISDALTEKPGRGVVLPNRHLTGAPSIVILACVLKRPTVAAFPAIIVSSDALVEFHRAMLTEALPDAGVAVVDWCHPAPSDPAQVTLIGESQLARSAATLVGYEASTIAVFGDIDAPDEKSQRALRSLLHARDALVLVEEWTFNQVLADVLERSGTPTNQDALTTAARWLDGLLDPNVGAATRTLTDQLLAVRDLCPSITQAAA